MKDIYHIAIASTSLTAKRLAECMVPDEIAVTESEGLFKIHFFGHDPARAQGEDAATAPSSDKAIPLYDSLFSENGANLRNFSPRLDVVVFPEAWIYRYLLMDKHLGGIELPMCCAWSEATDGQSLEDWLGSILKRNLVVRAAIGTIDLRT
jgi:hypothetical protein